MTRRATFTQAEMERAMRAAAKLGKVAVYTHAGIAFLDQAQLPQTVSAAESAPDSEPDAYDEWKQKRADRAQRAS